MDREQLIELLHADRACQALNQQLREMPARIDSLRDELGRHRETVALRERELEEMEQNIRRQERELKQQEEKLERLHRREGAVQTLRAMEAGESEIANIKSGIGVIEERLLEKIESRDILARELSLRQMGDREQAEQLKSELSEREADLRTLQQDHQRSLLERQRVLDRLAASQRRGYERLYKSFGHGALAALMEGACGGCGEKLPAQDALEVRQVGRVIHCQGCGRLILSVES